MVHFILSICMKRYNSQRAQDWVRQWLQCACFETSFDSVLIHLLVPHTAREANSYLLLSSNQAKELPWNGGDVFKFLSQNWQSIKRSMCAWSSSYYTISWSPCCWASILHSMPFLPASCSWRCWVSMLVAIPGPSAGGNSIASSEAFGNDRPQRSLIFELPTRMRSWIFELPARMLSHFEVNQPTK